MKVLLALLLPLIQATCFIYPRQATPSSSPEHLSTNRTVEAIKGWVDGCELVYDLSESFADSYALSRLQTELNFTHLLAWDSDLATDLGSIYPHVSREAEAEAASVVLKQLNVRKILVIAHDNFLASSVKGVVQESIILPRTPQFARTLNRMLLTLRGTGVRTVFVDVESSSAKSLFEALEASHFLDGLHLLIMMPRTSEVQVTQGNATVLALVEEGLGVESTAEANARWVALDKTTIVGRLRTRLMNLVNKKSNQDLGTISSSLLLTEFSFLNDRIPIPIAAFRGIHNPSGIDNVNALYFKGMDFALERENDTLGQFFLSPSAFNCSASEYNTPAVLECLSGFETSLVAGLSPYSSSGTRANIEALKSLNISLPIVGCFNTAGLLSDSKVFPMFVRVITTNQKMVFGIITFMKHYDYKTVHLFYSNETFGRDFAEALKEDMPLNGMTIETPVELQAIPGDKSQPEFLEKVADYILQTNIRPAILILLSSYRKAFFDTLARRGVKAEDFMSINQPPLNFLWSDLTEPGLQDRMQVLLHCFDISQSSFTGEYGRELEKEFNSKLENGEKTSAGHCQYFDGTLHLIKALKKMMLIGKDFMDANTFMAELRSTSFVGCTGKISIEKDSNDRRDQANEIFNVMQEGKTYFEIKVALISKTNSMVWEELSTITWPGENNLAPLQHRLNRDEDCGFYEEYDQKFEAGLRLLTYICMAFGWFSIVQALGVLLYSARSEPEMLLLEDEFKPSIQDRVQGWIVHLKFLQYMSVVMTQEVRAKQLLSIFALSFITEVKSSLTKLFLWICSSYMVCWSLLTVNVILKRSDKCHSKWLIEYTKLWLPILHEVLFFPVVSFMLKVFSCSRANSSTIPGYSDSYFDYDCTSDCWEGAHLLLALTCLSGLLGGTILTMHYQRVWFDLSLDYTVQGCSDFFVTRTAFEVVLGAVSNSDLSDTTQSLTLLVVFCGYFATLKKLRQVYNYPSYSQAFRQMVSTWGVAITLYLLLPFICDTRSWWVSIMVSVVLLFLYRKFDAKDQFETSKSKRSVMKTIMTDFLKPVQINEFFTRLNNTSL
jgi:ABC-type branched-subunit amino acid transport system substrate-binding protein